MFNPSYCRLCLLHDNNFIQLFNNSPEENLVNKIMTIANVEVCLETNVFVDFNLVNLVLSKSDKTKFSI